jgi:hypothetical protein
MTVITSTIIEGGGMSPLRHPSARWGEFSPNNINNRRVEDEKVFQT